MSSPNVILVIWDTARAENLPCYGYPAHTTPRLDRFAHESIFYARAVSVSPWTLPSHASLFTGLYPSEHTVSRWRSLSNVPTRVLAERLHEIGYQTVGFSSNAWISRHFGFERGFDQFFYSWQLCSGATDFFEVLRRTSGKGPISGAWVVASATFRGTPLRNLANGVFGKFFAFKQDKGARWTNRLVERWLSRDYDWEKPFFMFINFMEPHLPYRPPRSHRSLFLPQAVGERDLKSLNHDAFAYMVGAATPDARDFALLEAMYNAELRYLDDRNAELLQLLEESSVLDNSIVIITSDHGENIGDHGLMDHQYCLYDTLLHVPLIIRMPGTTYPAQTVDAPVEVKDIFYTLLDFLQIGSDLENSTVARRSLLPDRLLSDALRPCFAEYLEPQPTIKELEERFPGFDCRQYDRALRAVYSDDGLKLIWASDGLHELYDLRQDPWERQNLSGTHVKKVKELQGLLEARLLRLPQAGQQDGDEPIVSEAIIRRRLEDLGYL